MNCHWIDWHGSSKSQRFGRLWIVRNNYCAMFRLRAKGKVKNVVLRIRASVVCNAVASIVTRPIAAGGVSALSCVEVLSAAFMYFRSAAAISAAGASTRDTSSESIVGGSGTSTSIAAFTANGINSKQEVLDGFAGRRGFTAPFNLASLPALSINCGFTSGSLPVGLQIAGKPFAEETLFRVAHAYEQATEWHTRRPPMVGA